MDSEVDPLSLERTDSTAMRKTTMTTPRKLRTTKRHRNRVASEQPVFRKHTPQDWRSSKRSTLPSDIKRQIQEDEVESLVVPKGAVVDFETIGWMTSEDLTGEIVTNRFEAFDSKYCRKLRRCVRRWRFQTGDAIGLVDRDLCEVVKSEPSSKKGGSKTLALGKSRAS